MNRRGAEEGCVLGLGRRVIRAPHDASILVRSLVVKSRRAEN